jgi:hypothetical protein
MSSRALRHALVEELDRLEIYGVIVDAVDGDAVLVKHGHVSVMADGDTVMDILKETEIGDMTEDGLLELFLWASDADESDDGEADPDVDEDGNPGSGGGYDSHDLP